MPERLPLACTQFGKQGQAQLAVYAQDIHDGLLAQIATFPTPPILPAALQTLINNYNTALTDAALLGKEKVQAKNAARIALENALRADCSYVNQIVQDMIASGTNYADAKTLIESTNYTLSVDPSPVGPLPKGVIRSYRSTKSGQLDIIVVKISGAKSYTTQYTTDPTFTTYETIVSPTTRIAIMGLQRASVVYARFYGNGSNTSGTTYSDTISQVIV